MTHELSLMTDILRKIETVARRNGRGSRVVSVTVRVGSLAHLSPGHLRDHFRDSTRGTLAEGAELHVNVSGRVDDDPHAQDLILESVEVETE